jgi:hypothetical protein
MDKLDIRSFPGKQAPKPASNLPKNAHERALALIGLMDRLAACVKRESEAIRSRRPVAEIKALVKEKEPMVLVYEEISRLLWVDKEGVAALPTDVKAKLKEAAARLKVAGQDNADTLRTVSAGQQVLVDTVAAAVGRAKAGQASAYQPTAGGGRAAPRGYGPQPGSIRPAAVSLNATL